MKKNLIMYLIVIVMAVVGIVLIIVFRPSKSVSYDKLKAAGGRNYEVNISYSNVDSFNVYGEYDSNNKVLKYESDNMDEEYKSVNVNLYDALIKYLPNKGYENDSKEIVSVSSNDLFKNIRFLNIHNESTNMKCEYEIFDNVLYSISCVSDNDGIELLNIDFMFK